jgi:hypothetical protein
MVQQKGRRREKKDKHKQSLGEQIDDPIEANASRVRDTAACSKRNPGGLAVRVSCSSCPEKHACRYLSLNR